MKVLIIGAGRMGLWFYRRLESLGHTAELSERRRERAEELRAQGYRLYGGEGLRGYDMIISATNIGSLQEVIEGVEREGFSGPFVEIGGIKSPYFRLLSGLSYPVSVHPLFGPGASTLIGKKVILVPVKDAEREMSMARKIFEEATIVAMSPEEHDRLVLRTIQLMQLLSIIFNRIAPEEDWSVSQSLMKYVESVSLSGSEELVREMFRMNPYVEELRKEVERAVSEVFDGSFRIRERGYFERLYRKAYRMIESDG
ncbi:MAG: hypothetical protein ACP5LW_04610 [Nitrososphaeria archaeon]